MPSITKPFESSIFHGNHPQTVYARPIMINLSSNSVGTVAFATDRWFSVASFFLALSGDISLEAKLVYVYYIPKMANDNSSGNSRNLTAMKLMELVRYELDIQSDKNHENCLPCRSWPLLACIFTTTVSMIEIWSRVFWQREPSVDTSWSWWLCSQVTWLRFNSISLFTSRHSFRAGSMVNSKIHKRIDIFYSLIGAALFITSGWLIIDVWQDGFRTRTRDIAMLKGALAIINGVLFLLDCVFTFKEK